MGKDVHFKILLLASPIHHLIISLLSARQQPGCQTQAQLSACRGSQSSGRRVTPAPFLLLFATNYRVVCVLTVYGSNTSCVFFCYYVSRLLIPTDALASCIIG